ncbi:MAG: VOC family protein [Proteobacteria bacterium]|nr:VOC family protein [Pseudomonadota bacterium]MBU4472468.1 VOC family protein [Pseudomonadota bacterium]MCG2751295.1 VOC family protein [Desulfobacteraceae bacterium]
MGITGMDHIVVRVKDIEEGIKTFRDKLGMTLERTSESEAMGIKQAFFPFPNGGFLEVIAPLGPDSPVGKALEGRGEGIHTMSLAVDDLSATVKTMQDSGAQLIGVGSPQVFVHPKSAHGILLQLTERK